MPKPHTVRANECLHSIGYNAGFFPDTLWRLHENQALRDAGRSPHQLVAGDTVFIPELRVKTVDCGTEKVHRFRRRGVPKRLKLQLLDGDSPIASHRCEVEVDGEPGEATSDDEGWIDYPIAPDARRARVTVMEGWVYDLELGGLDPVDQMTGVQRRLMNLGLYNGGIDGEHGRATTEALLEFQRRSGLQTTGSLDPDTQAALIECNGG